MTGGTITAALRTAQSGLLVNQAALDAVSQNITNVNSDGYSRKIVELEQRVVEGTGVGVQISDVTRRVDEQLLKSMRLELSSLNRISSQDTYYERMQEIFGAPGDNTSIAHRMQEFTAALESLATSPDKSLDQSEVVRQAQNLVEMFHDLTDDIQELRVQADKEIADGVERVNTLITDIGDLNDQIVRNSSMRLDVSDLRDQRDLKLNELAEFVDIRYFFRSDGDAIVFTSGGRTLVDNTPSTLIHAAASTVTPTTTHAEGDFEGIYVNTKVAINDITNEIRDGKMKGLIELRDTTLAGLQSQLDEMAGELQDTFNQIHNRGVAFPGGTSFTGSRDFVNTAATMTYSGTTDTTVTLFDASGDQSATTTIRTLIGGASTTIANLATQLQTWLQANGAAGAAVSVTAGGGFNIELNSTTVNLAFRDQTATANGSTHQDATINYDINADATTDETVSGFSNFLGLNDFFTDNISDNIWDTDILDSSHTFGTSATYAFRDTAGQMASTLTINTNDSLSTVVTNINALNINVTASLVPEGDGFRLRITHDTGIDLAIYKTAGAGTPLADANLHVSDVRMADSIDVRSDIKTQPSKVVRGAVQWDANKGVAGEYYVSVADESMINALATQFTGTNTFEKAGGLATLSMTFDQYGAAIIAHNANLADINQVDGDYQRTLTESLQFKANTVSGVNLDEEMAQLILFEQAYSAAARVITIIQSMFDALDRAVA